jgi:organic hydroperoxide reductase OsmC/OhrA
MQALPHTYTVRAGAEANANVALAGMGLPDLESAPPREFDGPGDRWSPETLVCAAVVSCFILTFRAIARASRCDWLGLECTVEGRLERVDSVTRFTHFLIRARLRVPPGAHTELCRRLLDKAERGCLVTNSLQSQTELETEIVTAS